LLRAASRFAPMEAREIDVEKCANASIPRGIRAQSNVQVDNPVMTS
jgi:hypothetical protein